jgi:hypothetical protein
MRGISVPPGGVGRRPQTERLGRLRQAKIRENRACLAAAADHENLVKDRYFVKMATDTCILDDFRHKNYQKLPVDGLKLVFFNEKTPR